MTQKRARLIHWKPEEAGEPTAILEAAGYGVTCELPAGAAFLRELAQELPERRVRADAGEDLRRHASTCCVRRSTWGWSTWMSRPTRSTRFASAAGRS